MNEQMPEEMGNGGKTMEEEMKQKMSAMQEKVSGGINKAMSATAEKLDQTADKMHYTARFFRSKNADTIKEDLTNLAKKYPTHTLVGAIIVGFLFGKMLSR